MIVFTETTAAPARWREAGGGCKSYRMREEAMRLTILGSGDAFSSGGRLPSCYLLEHANACILLDCGPSILLALKAHKRSSNAFSHIFISHLHGDHMGGLPFLLLDAIFLARRSAPLTLVGPPGLEARFRLACEVFYPGSLDMPRPFELNFVELDKEVRHDFAPLGLVVIAYAMEHFSGSPSYGLRFEGGGKVFAYSGDSGWMENVVRVGKHADLYLIECYQYDFKLPMHMDYLTIAEHFDAIDARTLLLTHMSEAMLAHAEDVDLSRCRLAKDGLVVDI
jgi:ribonuclease BN (tRNA processing enzyme)